MRAHRIDVEEQEPAFLIAAARRAVARITIRDVAIQAGISRGGLWNLINGKTRVLYGPTINRLRTWYLRQWAGGSESLTLEAASYLMQQLLAPIDAGERWSAGLELLDALERIYKGRNTPMPAWLAPVAEEFRRASYADAELDPRVMPEGE